MTTITKEWLQQTIAEFENTRDDIPFGLSDDDAKILIVLKRALALLDAEPVAYNQVQRDMMKDIIMRKMVGNLAGEKLVMDDIHAVTMALIDAGFRTAPPASERERIRREHAEWSDATFGDVGPVGPLKHLSKEALEAAADPSDPLEWADMQFLLWDAQRRMGLSDEFITRAMIEKLEINKSRQWPEPKDGEPRLHIKEQPVPVVPVVPEEITADGIIGMHECGFVEGWNACRAAMLQAGNHTEQHLDMVDHSGDANEKGSDGTFIDEGTKQAGNSPVIPDGWIICSERMPAQDDWVLIYSKYGEYLAGQVQGKYVELNDGTLSWLGAALHWMPLPEPPKK